MSTFPIFHGIRLADNSTITNFNVEQFATDPLIAKNEELSEPATPVDAAQENSLL